MGNAKTKQLGKEFLTPPKKHYCPECPATADGGLAPMRPTLVLPKRRVEFRCPNGHGARKGATILR